MRSIQSGLLCAVAASLLALGACDQAQQAKPTPVADPKEPAAATVNGKPISQKAVDTIAKETASPGRPDTPETRKRIVDQLAIQMLAAQEAVTKGLDKTPEVADQLENARQAVLATAYVQDYIKNTPVTDEMLKAEYDRIVAAQAATQYKARHILVQKEADAKDIIARLNKNPAVFEKLAAEKSTDPGSKTKGGDLGWFDSRQMVPEFAAALATLQKGKFTEEPVKTQFGYHVILLEDSKPADAPPLDSVKPQLTRRMQQQAVMKQLEDLKSKAKIEVAAAPAAPVTPEAPAPAATGAPPAAPATPAPAPATK